MKQLPLFLMLVGLFACNSPIHDDLSFSRGDTTRPNTDETKNDNESPELPKDKTLYACGVVYADGHPSELVLFKDGLRQFSIKCTDENHISPDADSHFLLDGTLFTSFNTKGKTFISKNGEPLYEFNAEEYLKDMLLVDQTLWSLSIPLNENGFKIRKDGEVVFSKQDGSPKSLYLDESDVCLEYSTLWNMNKKIYLVKNTIETLVTPPHSATLLDARIHEGKIWYLEYNNPFYILSTNGVYRQWMKTYGFEMFDTDILPLENSDCAAVIHQKSNYSPMSVDQICIKDSTFISGNGTASYYYTLQAPARKVTLTKDRDKLYINGSDGNEYFEENVFFPNRRCGAQEDGKLYLCLSQKDGKGYPFIWCEGKKMPYKFQGELTGICITAPN